jgi:hypothetical protein
MRTRAPMVILFLALSVVAAPARDVRVFIAPRVQVIPHSGRVVFDIYWVNSGEKPAVIPALERYSFVYLPVGPVASGSTVYGAEVQGALHAAPNRQLAPHTLLREHATADIRAKGVKVVEVTAEFHGERTHLKSNTVLLRMQR